MTQKSDSRMHPLKLKQADSSDCYLEMLLYRLGVNINIHRKVLVACIVILPFSFDIFLRGRYGTVFIIPAGINEGFSRGAVHRSGPL